MKRLNRIQVGSITIGLAGSVALIFFFTSSVTPQPVPDESRALANAWLLDTCDVSEEGKLEKELRASRTQLEPIFLQAFEQGPDSGLIREVEQAAAKRFDQREEMFKSGSTAGLSKEDLEAARSLGRDKFISQAKDDFVTSYKSRALSGLGVVDGPKALEVLQKTARDEKSPLKGSAEQALIKLQQFKKAEGQK